MKKNFMFLAAGVTALCFASCNAVDLDTDNPNNPEEEITTHTCQMIFNGEVCGFDGVVTKTSTQTKATTSSSWKDGDIVYITFYNGTATVPGQATYTIAGGWSVSYDGNLSSGSSLKCEVRYFANATFQSVSLVSLNSETEIYEALSGTYDYSGSTITVTATMTPKTGRIRFTGTASSVIYLTGITVYTTYAPANNAFSTTNAMIKSTVATTGSTPYIYGFFADSDRSLGLVGADFAFTRTCSTSVLNEGDSGYMAIPSDASHNNWKSGLYIKASGVEFKMIPVSGYTGGFFMIGETEVTEALYKTVNGTSSTSLLPASGMTFSSVTSFIEKLNHITKLEFSVPTSAQWKYAAKGGSKSQSYTYAGSNTPGDVAWYSANTSSRQNVKTKAPNELGIYDMSGNVGEFVSDKDGSYNYVYGGCYKSTTTYITSTSGTRCYYGDWGKAGYSDSYSNSDVGAGFRLMLTCH